MKINIREIRQEEIPVLERFLYEVIFIPEGTQAPPFEIIYGQEVYQYIKDFGAQDDYCLVAEVEGKIVGAAWSRVLDDELKGYGNIGKGIPEIAISLLKEYRGNGIGTELLSRLLELLHSKKYQKVSLSVQKENYAYRMYVKAGFVAIQEQAEDYLMVCELK